jgi:hypothetical protein
MTTFFHSYLNTTIEPTAVLISQKNPHQPSNFWISESIENRALSFFIYIGFWVFILHGLETHSVGHPISIKIGFVIGFLLLILYDFLFNYATQLAIDAENKKFVEANTLSQNIVLDNKIFKLNKTQGLVIKNSVFEKLKREKKLNSVSIQTYRDSEYVKTLGAEGDQDTPLAAYEQSSRLLLSGSYMFITVITACILASHHNKQLLASMLPFATTSGVLAVAFIGLWFVDRNYTSLITTEKIKSKIFITAFSFALTAVITPFFFV